MKKYYWTQILKLGVLCTGLLTVGQFGGTAGVEAAAYDRVASSDGKYEQLFGKEKMEAAVNDPELANTMKRFVYGDVVEQTKKLSDKQRQLVTIVVLAANQNEKLLRKNVEGALKIGVTPLEIREALYQVTPYIGFAKAFEALDATNAVFSARGIKLPLPAQGTVTEADRFDKGIDVQIGIYGDRIKQSRANAPADQMHIQDDLAEFCFGDTYTRGVLDIQMRELLTVSVLDALGTEPQMKGHILGNLKVGNGRETIIAAFTTALPYVGFPRTLNAMRCVNEVTDAMK